MATSYENEARIREDAREAARLKAASDPHFVLGRISAVVGGWIDDGIDPAAAMKRITMILKGAP